MRAAGIQGLSGRPRHRKSAPHAAATDRVGRQFAREARDQLWVTDQTQPTLWLRIAPMSVAIS
jgi:putative transposase